MTQRFTTQRHSARARSRRKGVIVVLSAFMLVVIFAFVAMSVDTGRVVLTQTNMQNAVDAAALAASQEIALSVQSAGENNASVVIDANSIAVSAARLVARQVAEANGVYVDPQSDVDFGKRTYDPASATWTTAWGVAPYNVVRVTARRDQQDVSSPDGRLPLTFGWAVGQSSASLTTVAAAYVDSRDIVVVLDFSGSMNDDSCIAAFGRLGRSAVESNLDGIWSSLVAAAPKWPGTTQSKFPSTGFGSINSAYGTYLSTSNSTTAFNSLGLGATISGGAPRYPFPQGGKNTNGDPNSMPSASVSRSRWLDYIAYVQQLSGTYRKRYGYRTLMNYLMERREFNNQSEDLWRTPHYPFHAVKEGCGLFLEFLTDLDFGDEVGMVSYAEVARIEATLDEDGVFVDLSTNPISGEYTELDLIQRHKQAAHYESYTGIGYGVEQARLLLNGHSRYGARPTMLLMTDGLANRYPSNWSLPAGWSWASLADYDGDGYADYSTSDRAKQYAFYQAKLAIDNGITIHTMSVGVDADRDFMRAIAFAAGGVWIDVPGGATIADMQEQMLDAFRTIAAKVPPAKLVYGSAN